MSKTVLKITVPFWICLAILLGSCKPTAPENTEANHSAIKDSIKVTQKDSVESVIQSTKSLPDWPLNPKVEEGKRYPFDEGTKDQNFTEFRKNLFAAVIEKDISTLRSIIHNDIKFSFGAENGKADFLKTWQLDSNPNESNLWYELETILGLGGAFWDETKSSFYAPYIFMLEDIDDPYMQGVIIGENVRLREQAGSNSKIIGALSWDLVEFVEQDDFVEETINGETHPWKKVKTSKGEIGYVYEKYVRSPIDFRAGFSKYEDNWMMDLFIAGD